MRKNILPYTFLSLLGVLIVVTMSVRYGISVEKKNMTNEFIQDLIVKLTLTPAPKQVFETVVHKACSLKYVITEGRSKDVAILCPESPSASDQARLLSEGYAKKDIGTVEAYLKIPDELRVLVEESIHTY